MTYRYAEDMKYLALYWALKFIETEENIMVKEYKNRYKVVIDVENQFIDFGKEITIVGSKVLSLTSHKSFVILECVDRLLNMGYAPSEIIIDLDNEFDLYVNNLYIKCFEWNHEDKNTVIPTPNTFISIKYQSRLTSGMIERKVKIFDGIQQYHYGLFDELHRYSYDCLRTKESIECNNPDFIIDDDRLIKYTGSDKIVAIPDGIKLIGPAAFWDNQSIEEVILPESLVSLGGDTFYNCRNLRKITIPSGVKEIANNPFAGCPNLVLNNKSRFFKYINGVLFDKEKSILIYYSLLKKDKKYTIPKTVKILGKHCFFLANSLEKLVIPKSVIKLENNPFSGCTKLDIVNHSKHLHIIDKVIYNRYKTSVIGCLNSIETECLCILPVKNIGRNSFWNCKGIKKIVLPSSLKQIGYNPFVGCTNIHFVSESDEYVVEDDVLYTKNKDKLICYPSWKAIDKVRVDDRVTVLERGAFSGCSKLKEIDLCNVTVISKSCFTNCSMLLNIFCKDCVVYIGEWAFAYCSSLKTVQIAKNTKVDNNALLNSTGIIRVIE